MLLRFLDHLEEWIISVLIATATVIIFLAVIHRYASSVPLLFPYAQPFDFSWAQELCIYMFVWMAKFGAAYGVRTGIHVGVDLVVNMLGEQSRRKVILFGLFGGALFTGIVAALGTDFVIHIYRAGQFSIDLEWPMWLIYLAIPLGSSLMCFRFLQAAWLYYRNGELAHHDPSHVEGLDAPAPLESRP